MKNMCLSHAIAAAVSKKIEADPAVYLLGEDIINKGGGLSTYLDVPKKFPGRCFDMSMAELGFTHFANGMALAGLRPIVDLMFSDFTTIPSDAIINGAAKYRFNSLGKASVPAVYVMGNGARGFFGGYGSGCNHSQCSKAWFMNVPGIKMVMPYYPADALGLMRASIRDNDPVIFLFYQCSSGVRGEVPEEDYIMPLHNAANILRVGQDITIVALQSAAPVALKAAEQLEAQGISAEMIDPRVIIPLDKEKLIASAKKTGRLLVVQEAPTRGGVGSEIISVIMQEAAGNVKAVKLAGALNTPIGSGYTEAYMMPKLDDVRSL